MLSSLIILCADVLVGGVTNPNTIPTRKLVNSNIIASWFWIICGIIFQAIRISVYYWRWFHGQAWKETALQALWLMVLRPCPWIREKDLIGGSSVYKEWMLYRWERMELAAWQVITSIRQQERTPVMRPARRDGFGGGLLYQWPTAIIRFDKVTGAVRFFFVIDNSRQHLHL